MIKKSLTILLCLISAIQGFAQQEEILVHEDFSRFSAGEYGNPDTRALCSFEGTYDEMHIDPSLTSQPGWFGGNIYQAGGMCYMKSAADGSRGAVLDTPLNDYSGTVRIVITVECPATAQNATWFMTTVDYGDYQSSDCDRASFEFNIEPGETQTLTMTTTNRTGSSDGFIDFFCMGELYVHDVEVGCTPTILGNPQPLEPEYRPDGILFKWLPTRCAQDYRLNIMEMIYTADTDVDTVEDFEALAQGKTIPDVWSSTGNTALSENEGSENSKGLIMRSGSRVSLPQTNTHYTHCKYWCRVVSPDGTVANVSNMKLVNEVWNGSKWVKVATFNLDYIFENQDGVTSVDIDNFLSRNVDMFGCRLSVTGSDKGGYIVIDNVEYGYYRPGDLKPVVMDNGNEYVTVDGTEYFFDDFDPAGEYFYSVQACQDSRLSGSILSHAFGLHAPVVSSPSDVTENSFTLNFEPSVKADKNNLTLMGVRKINNDIPNMEVIAEDFNGFSSSSDSFSSPEMLNNHTEISLDEYCSNPGWSGQSNAICNGMIGGTNDVDFPSYVKSPVFWTGESDHYIVTLTAYGMIDDQLMVNLSSSSNYLLLSYSPIEGNPRYGMFSGSFPVEIISPDKMEQFCINSFYGWEFMIDEFRITRDAKDGETQLIFIDKKTLPGDSHSYSYSGLNGFQQWAWTMSSEYGYEDKRASSTLSPWQFISTVPNAVNVLESVTNIEVESIYSLDGTKLNAPHKGINIIRMSDGTVRKVMVK